MRRVWEDFEEPAGYLGKCLQNAGWRLSTAESCTGGGVAYAVTAIPGSSAWFDRGFVTYSNFAKQQMLGVQADTLQNWGAVSKQTVQEMAQGALQYSTAQISVAISGIAGPGGALPDKPVGLVWFAWASPNGGDVEKRIFAGDRRAIRAQAILTALEGLIARTGAR